MKSFQSNFMIIIIGIVISSFIGYNRVQKTEGSISASEIAKSEQVGTTAGGIDDSVLIGIKSKTIKYKEDLCMENETLVFSFRLADRSKTVSVCMSRTQPDYIVYRFGAKEKIQFEFPANKVDSWNEFTYSYYLRGGEVGNEGMDLNYLTFASGGYEYRIYQEYRAKEIVADVGIKIIDKITNKETDIKGLSNSIKGSLMNLRENKRIKIKII